MASDAAISDDAANYGFNRSEMFSSSLSNTVDPYDRHIFLCYKSRKAWPSKVEDSDEDPLPKSLSAALKARKDDIPLKTRLTVCEGCEGVQCSDGDVLIFPEMIKYRGLTVSDVDSFVDDVLVNGNPWASAGSETLAGAYVFVCAHASRDKRCGVCGPVLIEKFQEEIGVRGLIEQVFVSACSHVGGHKYAGNVIIFGTNAEGKVVGDWYGYVTPADVTDLIDVHIGKGEIIEKLWRGQMGMKVEVAEKEEEKKPATETFTYQTIPEQSDKKQQSAESEGKKESSFSCCQGINAVSCCREASSGINGEVGEVKQETARVVSCKKSAISLPGWMGQWEQSDVLMAAAVVGAVATVAVAYSIFRRSA